MSFLAHASLPPLSTCSLQYMGPDLLAIEPAISQPPASTPVEDGSMSPGILRWIVSAVFAWDAVILGLLVIVTLAKITSPVGLSRS